MANQVLYFDEAGVLTLRKSSGSEKGATQVFSAKPPLLVEGSNTVDSSWNALFTRFIVVFMLAVAGFSTNSASRMDLDSTLFMTDTESILRKIVMEGMGFVASAVASIFFAGVAPRCTPRTFVLWFSILMGASCICHRKYSMEGVCQFFCNSDGYTLLKHFPLVNMNQRVRILRNHIARAHVRRCCKLHSIRFV